MWVSRKSLYQHPRTSVASSCSHDYYSYRQCRCIYLRLRHKKALATTKRMTPEMAAFHTWMRIMHPDEFQLPQDPDPDIEQGYRAALEYLRVEPWDVRLSLGKATLEYYRKNPNSAAATAHLRRVTEAHSRRGPDRGPSSHLVGWTRSRLWNVH
jgi:hypothetical protein